MADERYQWLDQKAAERLLRGEPVDAVDDHSRAEALWLAQALAAARPAPLASVADAELPGEAAALAAFREARAERGLASAPSAFAPTAAELGAVRLRPVPAARRWGRSLRYGLAAAVAAVAVGGVAVASGTGMLPFTTDRPGPAGTVSALDTPEPVASDASEFPHVPDPSASPDTGFGTGTPSAPPSGDGSPGASSSTPAPPATAGPGGSAGTGGEGDTTPEPGTSTGTPDRDGSNFGAKIVEACRDFRAGRIDDTAKSRLEKSARGGETLRRFCERVLGGDSSGGKGDGAGDGKGDGDSSGEGERAGSDSRRDGWGDDQGNDRTSDRNTGHAKGSAPAAGTGGTTPDTVRARAGDHAPDGAEDRVRTLVTNQV
ncbi:hypothetical protein M5362_21180 [Streptomyces sp. Je 1-79]|uniref:hypothetical protein n=1 Tax=Streptomyces sp. Je 1-79 TaxID=2943847 RepID=UPI0021A63D80|nr:hypothetical protein [Streptomyces sp. Je 1-79]MCT4355654.1 hypothetical protein [Streptomyces sp. Je 1-79]